MEPSRDPFEAVHGAAMPVLRVAVNKVHDTSDAGGGGGSNNSRHSDTTQDAPLLQEQPSCAGAAAGGATQQAAAAPARTAKPGPSQPASPESAPTTAPAAPAAVKPEQPTAPAAVTPEQPAAPAAAVAGVPSSAAQPPEQLEPLAPPEPSEGPDAAAEYAAYLQRWQAGDTLAQRWHRLAAKGLLSDIKAEWEEWQLDVVLQQLKQSNASLAHSARAAAAGGRARRGRGDVEEPADMSDEPRRVRSRRAPSTLQDYHVDAPGPGDRQDGATPEPSGSRLQGRAGAAASDDSGEEEAGGLVRAHQQQQQLLLLQQQRAAAPRIQRAPQPQHQHQLPPQLPPPGSRMAPLPLQQQALLQHQHHHQQQQQLFAQHHHHLLMQQQQQQQQQHLLHQQQAAAAGLAGPIPPEVLQEAYKVGARLGAAFLQQQDGEGGSSPRGLAANKPAAMAAFMQALCQYGANPAAMASIAALAQQQQR